MRTIIDQQSKLIPEFEQGSESQSESNQRIQSVVTNLLNGRQRSHMGLTDEEYKTVQYYLEKLRELGKSRHPEDNTVADNHKSDSELTKWNTRMRDDIEGEVLNPEEYGRHFEGDIILFPEQAKEIYENALKEGKRRVKRKFIGSKLRRWDPTHPIVYSFDGSHTSREQRIIELALEHWHNITCLNFVRNDNANSGNRIIFTDVDGCASNVGRHPLGEEQLVSLAPECIRLGVIAHEVAHALGFWHEQSRPDRDQFVNVRWENIDKDSKGQFLKEDPDDVDNAGVPYDYGSIMHYRSKAFSRYDDLYTISTFVSDYQKTIGQRDQLSFNDIRLMNKIYCSNVCPKKLPCQRGGYTDPRRCDRCRCPDGFTGQFCEQVMTGYGAVCGGKIQNCRENCSSGQECSWLLVAPPGQIVEMQFIGEFEMYCKVRHSLCMDYVEVRNSTDFANTGMRYCCYGTPNTSIRSATTDLVVLFRSFYRGGRGFEARARALPVNGQWTAWTQWTPCTASCGACGSRMRTRVCPHGACSGEPVENQVCNTHPCSGLCAQKKTEDGECSGFLALLRGVRCKHNPYSERTVMEPCENACCPGFTVVGGRCVR
ncbi:thrombospondin type 1 domain protein [Dictyocaulus viviparus]|uniref:Zinc metalloproteinase n=1 Tax=Dictyocaulus viviparus TaxID=29172 RepID=A0A0D8XRN0_DICVI|nr:thrombospondin type 1 domain protein [Dictyocaulus viviparus]